MQVPYHLYHVSYLGCNGLASIVEYYTYVSKLDPYLHHYFMAQV